MRPNGRLVRRDNEFLGITIKLKRKDPRITPVNLSVIYLNFKLKSRG